MVQNWIGLSSSRRHLPCNPMRSPPYSDFIVRIREAILLVKAAKRSTDPLLASACSKSASVLVAAALERYVNDALDHASRVNHATSWEDLQDGFRAILVAQIARRLHEATGSIQSPTEASELKKEKSLRTAVNDSAQAFDDPSSWSYMPQFGVFMDGAAAPNRLNATLLRFRPDGKKLFNRIEERGLDRRAYARALDELVRTRHATAHADPDPGPPSPNDVATWLSITFRLVREIEEYLREALSKVEDSIERPE